MGGGEEKTKKKAHFSVLFSHGGHGVFEAADEESGAGYWGRGLWVETG